MNPITFRPATAADMPFLWRMLFESAFTTDEVRAAWRSDPQPPPELVKYLEGWGRRGDAGVIVRDGDIPAGAAWYRLFRAADRGDGIIAERDVPDWQSLWSGNIAAVASVATCWWHSHNVRWTMDISG